MAQDVTEDGMRPTVLLKDYQDNIVRYVFNEGSGLVTEARFPDEAAKEDAVARRNVRGFGSWRSVGLLRGKHRVFVAVYSSQQKLVLRVGSTVFRWPTPSLSAKRTTVFPGIKQFRLQLGQETVLSFRYRYVDRETWPDNGDILSYVERMTRTPGDVARTIAFWEANAAGRDIVSQGLADELDGVARAVDPQWHS